MVVLTIALTIKLIHGNNTHSANCDNISGCAYWGFSTGTSANQSNVARKSIAKGISNK